MSASREKTEALWQLGRVLDEIVVEVPDDASPGRLN